MLHETIDHEAANNEGMQLSDMYDDDFVRDVIHSTTDFHVPVTTNPFGDICAKVINARAGAQRLSPSVWKTHDGLYVYGPTHVYNSKAYRSVLDANAAAGASAVTVTRAASMMVHYALEEPAPANTIQRAIRKTMSDMADDAPLMRVPAVMATARLSQYQKASQPFPGTNMPQQPFVPCNC